ncbi:MAG: hypothetical protein JJ939_08855 [Alphaproteobacteria bacterium]|jgi:hypothetical protein|nr:hypothetical protein [Rhodobiaceae bacterium]MBO6542745.1 hypothetical protein [Alphaproteobacteria bacterium]MBO6628517.1 hypothetical protein [Alphaproteobacteria bacterium]MDF1626180.1 hypothetical protein [Parvibaculaceae bacterium]|tara:strand:- start:498 stop:800 length:303 start_codon:yes stop_codon:yes gene_type:complete
MNIKFVSIGLVLAVLIGVGLSYGERKLEAMRAVANAVAKTTCTCVFVASRDFDSCLGDNPPGFEIASAWHDVEDQSASASVFVVARGTARYHRATGCALD